MSDAIHTFPQTMEQVQRTMRQIELARADLEERLTDAEKHVFAPPYRADPDPEQNTNFFWISEFITTSEGAADVGKPIVLDAGGHIDATMLNDADIDHGSIGGLTDVADHPGYLTLDGARALTADWDAGSYKITAETFESDVGGGTAPFVVASNTLVSNLNADLLDGNDAAAFAAVDHDAEHVTGGGDKIRDATAAQDGLMTAAYGAKLDGIEALADVTDTANVTSAGAVMKSTDIHTFTIEVELPTATDAFATSAYFPVACTLTEVRVYVIGATSVTFDLEERARDTLGVAGTAISAASITATTTPANVTMNNTGMAANTRLYYVASAIADAPTVLHIQGQYTVD